MRFADLSLREPVYTIFADTIPGFLADRYGCKYSAGWERPHTGEYQQWLCNPWLNAVFVRNVKRSPLEPVLFEYTTSIKPWLRLAQKVYVAFATKRATSALLSSRKFYLYPALPDVELCAFYGGNHRFRFINVKERRIYAILKSGYPERFIKNEITLRSKYEWLPSPGFITNNPGNTWFAEEIRAGTPINRLNNSDLLHQAAQSAFSGLCRLYDETREQCDKDNYVRQLLSAIKSLLKAHGPAVQNVLWPVAAALGNIRVKETSKITLAQTHGDFQVANILWDKTRSWLIDWEYTGLRSCLYDALTWDLGARTAVPLAKHIYSVINQTGQTATVDRVVPEHWHKPGVRRQLLAVYLLEELQLRLEEIDVPGFKKESAGFSSFCSSWLAAAQMVLNE
jgi:hypothetical protein